MNKRNVLLKRIDKIISEAEMLDFELDIYVFCRRKGLNYEDASDYATAVIESDRIRKEGLPLTGKHISNSVNEELLTGNAIENREECPYDNIRNVKIVMPNTSTSEYKFIDIIKNAFLLVKQKLIGRKVKNITNKRIAICGQLKNDPSSKCSSYLNPGESSAGRYDDVDVVLIAPDQSFFTSKEEASKKNGKIAHEGGIKVTDNITQAEVERSKERPDVCFVNASFTKYLTRSECEREGWYLP